MPVDPTKGRARHRVNYAVYKGRLPRPTTLSCTDCGAPASEYDHHLGYAPETALDVQPVCKPCHDARAAARGERLGRPRSVPCCRICGRVDTHYGYGRCGRCYQYWLRHGVERPVDLQG